MSNLNTIQRLLGAAAAVALCACALPAAAQQAQQEAASSMDAQTVARDAATGQLRAATPEEQAALAVLKAARQSRIAPKPTLQKFHTSGASGARLTDEFMTSSTAVRTPDGKIEMICNQAHGDQPAVAHVHAAANTPVTE
jgi:hypothetical protein